MSIVLKEETFQTLREFLLSREFDIVIGEEDFGCLKAVFEEIVGRKPKEERD